ncbi:MAG: Gfo/Idh/MocA family oxidoreductase [Lentisphaeria bacterium]|nr:Gfo/Idh/MocA family oxidoreductase [Lentisphaeria bacterium]
MGLKFAFAGVRHVHIFSLYNLVQQAPDLQITAVCEEDPENSLLSTRPDVKLTHTDFDTMLREADCDVVGIGDYFAKRGSMVIRALQAGKHVIADKPLCTSLEELEQIKALSAEKGLKVGCMYELRSLPSLGLLRNMVRDGELGELVQIQFSAQHPLQRETRPEWYFEEGKHGGTINDIASHGIDILPVVTGCSIKKILCARSWKALGGENDAIKDAGQFMLELSNGCGVMGDVSYCNVDGMGFKLPTYWRFNVWGSKGMAELDCSSNVRFYGKDAAEVQIRTADGKGLLNYLDHFLKDIAGEETELSTEVVLESARTVLEIQKMADQA